MREIRGGVFQGRFHNLLISKNNTFWAPQISRITFQVVFNPLTRLAWIIRHPFDMPGFAGESKCKPSLAAYGTGPPLGPSHDAGKQGVLYIVTPCVIVEATRPGDSASVT